MTLLPKGQQLSKTSFTNVEDVVAILATLLGTTIGTLLLLHVANVFDVGVTIHDDGVLHDAYLFGVGLSLLSTLYPNVL